MDIKVVPVDEVVAILLNEWEKADDPDAVPIDNMIERIGKLRTFVLRTYGDNLPDYPQE